MILKIQLQKLRIEKKKILSLRILRITKENIGASNMMLE